MDLVEPYCRLVDRDDRASFVARFPHLFFVKRPLTAEVDGRGEDGAKDWRYRTATVRVDVRGVGNAGPFPREWRIAAIRKREGNPFPERISIGRANNCDVVLRLPYVSKLHAHVIVEALATQKISDVGSANGVILNGQKLAPRQPHPMKPGDQVSLGHLNFEVFDAGMLYDLIKSGQVSQGAEGPLLHHQH